MRCDYCGKEVPELEEKCPACYCPRQSGGEEMRNFLQGKLLSAELEAEDAMEHVSKGRYFFYAIAVLFLLYSIVLLARNSYGGESLGMGIAGILFACAFVSFGIFLRKNPLLFSIIGLLCSFLFFGSILWIVSMVVMGLCLYFAYTYKMTQKQLQRIRMKLDEIPE